MQRSRVKRKPRPISRQRKLMKELDVAFSIFIRKRDGRCVQCGTTERLTCGHLISRVAKSVRWNELNCHCQCVGCNFMHEHRPEKFTTWFIEHFSIEQYQLLVSLSNVPHKYSADELETMLQQYRGMNGKE